MHINELILSDNKNVRIKRHIIFWMGYITFFYLQSVTPEVITETYNSNAFYFGWISVCCFLPACICSVYIFLYFLFPRYLQKKKYLHFFIAVVFLYAMFNGINYYMAILFFRNTCDCNINLISPYRIFGIGNNNAFLAIAIGLVAVGIKFTIKWYKQQKHNLELANLKVKSDLEVLKTKIQPDFLFHSLVSLYNKIQSGYSGSSKIVLKFSEILSYTLYDCEPEFLLLEKELEILNEYISFERMTSGTDCIINLSQTGDPQKKWIIPSLLLSLLQDYFNFLHNNNVTGIVTDIKINIAENNLTLLIEIHQLKKDTHLINLNHFIAVIRKRLDLLYKNSYQLRQIHENFQEAIELTLHLREPDPILTADQNPFKKSFSYETV